MTIYKVFNVNDGHFYIGRTVQPIETRLKQHLRDAFKKNSTTKFHKALRQDELYHWACEILYVTENEIELISIEMNYINSNIDNPLCLNSKKGDFTSLVKQLKPLK